MLGQGREASLEPQVRGSSCQPQRGMDVSHGNVAQTVRTEKERLELAEYVRTVPL